MDEEGLATVCSTLGIFQENGNGHDIYVKHSDCLESLKDIQRYMRRDHPESRDIFMQLGKWNIIRRDIVPLIVRYSEDHELVLNCVKVLVFLTMPIDPSSNQVSLQVEYLQHFRAALLDDDTIPVIMSLLEDPLQRLERGTPKDDDWRMFQLFLTLLRNLLAIPDSFTHHISASTQFAYLKERLLEILFKESVMELVVALTQHTAGRHGGLRHDNHLILELIHHVLMGQRPDVVAAAADEQFKVKNQAEKSSETLRALMYEEKAQLKSAKHDPALHSPFSGMFVRVAQDGTKTILTRTPHQSPLENLQRKPQIKRGPVKRVVPENHLLRPTNDHLQVLLKDFVTDFLASGYNVLMQTIKDDIRRERPENEAIDPVPFFQVVQFFTGYLCRVAQKDQAKSRQSSSSVEDEIPSQKHMCGSIASTMDEEMFSLVRSKWCLYIDEAQTTKDWGPVAAGVAVMKDMIHMLDIVLKRSGPMTAEGLQELRTARILVYKVFYDQTETGILQTVLSLLKGFDIHKQPRSFLSDLVEITHIVLRILEDATKEGTLRVLQKARRVSKKAKSAIRKAEKVPPGPPLVTEAPDVEERDSHEIAKTDENTSSFAEELSGIPDTETFSLDGVGVSDRAQEATAAGPTDNSTTGNTEAWGDNAEEVGRNPAEIIPDEDNDDDDDAELESMTKEVSLDVNQLVFRRFADNTIVRNYCWLLKYYTSNRVTTNYYVVRMLQRICEDRVLEPMLYQLSIFHTFYTILSDKQLQVTKDHKFVVGFLTKVVRGFFKKLKNQPMLYIELLFWKLKHECHNISADYMIHKLKKAVGGSSKGPQRINIADALGDDEDSALQMRAEEGHGRSGAEGDDQDASEDDDHCDSRTVNECSPLSESQEAQIKELFFKFKDKHDYASLIAHEVDSSSGITVEQVKRKLRDLGLLEHKGKRRRPSDAQETNQYQKRGRIESGKPKRKSSNGVGSRKRNKSSLFTELQDEELKVLFERHCTSRQCSRTIAESFGGQFTPAQVSRRLRSLGLMRQKPKSKLEAFLSNVRDADESGDSDREIAEQKGARSGSPHSQTTSSLDPPDDLEDEDDDDAPLASLLNPAAFSGEATTSRTQDKELPYIEPSRLDMRATFGRGARKKSFSPKGKEIATSSVSDDDLSLSLAEAKTGLLRLKRNAEASTSNSAVIEMDDPTEGPFEENAPDKGFSGDAEGSRPNEDVPTGLPDYHKQKASAVFEDERPPSRAEVLAPGLHASWSASTRKKPLSENHGDGDQVASESSVDGLRLSVDHTSELTSKAPLYEASPTSGASIASQASPARRQETPSSKLDLASTSGRHVDSHKNAEESGNVPLPNFTTEASPTAGQRASDPVSSGGFSQRDVPKVSKRRRLARKPANFQVLEDEYEDDAAGLSKQDVTSDKAFASYEASEDDGLNDF
ncbi:hypothetical protein AXG93_4530s1190 [Marchantia polymorpha subsp. ruderalis]|uniref:Timeless N-terminal domain-containing protein n=1 Tax=Marchantia polymorpha subsp. ruderalis TaxID=1480154 RepID=A0A176VUI7_MARPO|nr:hypothetical protein AXG93_4530s1190 [Marchantia polymorpha subsp. ruderalis]